MLLYSQANIDEPRVDFAHSDCSIVKESVGTGMFGLLIHYVHGKRWGQRHKLKPNCYQDSPLFSINFELLLLISLDWIEENIEW
jgi:hypothetical protein